MNDPDQDTYQASRLTLGLFLAGTLLFWTSLYVYVPKLSPYAETLSGSKAWAGIVVGSYGLTQLILRIPIGFWADRIGRGKSFILAGLVLSGLSALLMGAAPNVEILTVGGNWSDDVHTPVFKKYFVPWLSEVVRFLYSKGKLSQVHMDGEMKRLMPMFLESGVDIAEAWSPLPMTSVTTAELKKAWGDKVTIWGGVPSMLFEPQYSDQEFDDYVLNLFKEVSPGQCFIVGMGDNLPFDASIERVGRLVGLIEKYGHVPLGG